MSPNPYENVNAYSKNQKATTPPPTGNSRDTDARALLACARRLDDAKALLINNPRSKEYLSVYADAIRHNQRLWTIFQVAIADPENPLPDHLKITLLNLSRYIDKTSFRAIGKYQPTLIDSFININRMIAAGLSKKVEEQQATPSMPMREIPTSLTTSA